MGISGAKRILSGRNPNKPTGPRTCNLCPNPYTNRMPRRLKLIHSGVCVCAVPLELLEQKRKGKCKISGRHQARLYL